MFPPIIPLPIYPPHSIVMEHVSSVFHVTCFVSWLPGSESEMKQKLILILTYSSGNLSKLKIHVEERHMTYLALMTVLDLCHLNYSVIPIIVY